MTSLVESAFTAEHRRGRGPVHGTVNHGRLNPRRLRRLPVSTPLPRAADGRIVLTVDVSHRPRPDAPPSPESLFCHVYGRCRGADQIIPGRPCSFVAALETGQTSWTAALDAIRGGQAREHGGVLRRFDREHTFRLFQQTPGWTVPEARAPDPARD
ncbi:hypothetical protein TK78_10225 [Streptomyces sp. Tue 6075]|uniref:transposase n=1 Tax=Streptomyces sp. Tue 6075 TaxID=1661694 RepID=UPI00094A485C|nr:transposase [Streptomyces sp. Tue 6075]APS19298.1 hypothetical protein TK78_10225 [Streptomyces sp. Tue 6075]